MRAFRFKINALCRTGYDLRFLKHMYSLNDIWLVEA